MEAIRFALVGCSKIAHKHARGLRNVPGAALAAVCDLNQERAEAMGREYAVPWYTDYHQMMDKVPIEVVSVLTPSGDHATRILDLVKYGKHLVVEKPMVLRLDDADTVIRACDEAGVKIFEVKQNRYNRPVQALRQALDAGRLGKLVMGTVRVRWCRRQEYYDEAPWRGTWAWDGGVLTNQASHHIDLLQWMMGEVESVSAMTATRLVRIEAEDTGAAVLRFKSGALGIVEATTGTRPRDLEGSLSLLGERGSVVIGGFAMDRIVTWEFSNPEPQDATILETHGANPNDAGWSHGEYLRGVSETLRSGRKALVDGLEARKSIELITAIYESAETGATVPLRFRARKSRLGVARGD